MTHIYQQIVARLQVADGIPLLLLRLYLAPVLIPAGWNIASSFDSIVDWFGNGDYGLGFQLPLVIAILATSAEPVDGVPSLVGTSNRLVSLSFIVTMIFALVSAHA